MLKEADVFFTFKTAELKGSMVGKYIIHLVFRYGSSQRSCCRIFLACGILMMNYFGDNYHHPARQM